MSSRKLLQPSDRASVLTTRQTLKMARSAHAFVRGSTVQFYEWLKAQKRGTLPEGPPVWICGDCHAGNLGPVAGIDGRVAVQIRDLDQTVIGNPAHDIIRLALSLATASRGSDLPGVTTARILEQVIEGYRAALRQNADTIDDAPQSIQVVVRKSIARSWKHLAKERLEDRKPTIPLGARFWPLSEPEQKKIEQLFESASLHRLATSLRSREDDAPVEVLDAAYWMKGCSSLGLLRFAVLLGIGEGKRRDFALMDVKEAVLAAAPRYAGEKMPKDNAVRVVEGARHLSPQLGNRMMSGHLARRPVFIRELLPQDLKVEISQLTIEEAMKAASFLAGVVGKAHARQMDKSTRARWSKELERHRSKSLDAPSWLWTSVVSLIGKHEVAYLEHCRRYASQPEAA
ncbi:DUF2252 family protein [Bradyrhizobium sp. dw_411]|uniref:DUF2252 family protein n=1 Tax=Bradyrhizobium sp. dw_411 TaxID=2720082 RepID=UPI001BCE938F|nr:DUF2252 family protein [Bradyrhizobium sp. dw_411]